MYKIGFVKPCYARCRKNLRSCDSYTNNCGRGCPVSSLCSTRGFSMCRYPLTTGYEQARLYYPRFTSMCNCEKYLYQV